MNRGQFVGAFAVTKSAEELNVILAGSRSVLPDSYLLRLSYEGERINLGTTDGVTVLFVGEIFEYLTAVPSTVNKSITESILWLYRELGDDFAKNIDGHFVIVIYDHAASKLLVIQDKYTCYEKLFWTQKDGIFYFSNRIIALSDLADIPKNKFSDAGFYHLLKYAYLSPPHTIFDNVFQLAIGELIVIQKKTLNKTKYDDWTFSEQRIVDKNEALSQYREILTRSIHRQFLNHLPSVFLLSGGFDSSLNVAIAAQVAPERLITIGIGADDKFNTDAPFARKVSRLVDTDHHEHFFDGQEINALPQIVHKLEVPYFEPGLILTHSALQAAARHADVVIGGEAADQLFACSGPAAYRRYSMRKKAGPLFGRFCNLMTSVCRSAPFDGRSISHRIEGRLIGKYDVNNWYPGYGFWNTHIKELLKENFRFEDRLDNSDVPDTDLSSLYDYCCTRLNMEYALYGILGRYSGLSELHNIASYSPYVDRNVIDFVLSLDHNLRAPMTDSQGLKFNTKYLHKELAKEIFPAEIVNRPKQGGFIDNSIHFVDAKFLNRLKIKISKSEIINQYFRASYIESLFAQPKTNSTRIFLLTTLDLWHHLFASGQSRQAPTYTLSEYIE